MVQIQARACPTDTTSHDNRSGPMTTIRTQKCDECGAVLEGNEKELRSNGKGWRGVEVHVSAWNEDDIAALRGAGRIERDYCPKCVPDWAKP